MTIDLSHRPCASMMGPQFPDVLDRKRGRRRLDQADDWVEQAIAIAVKRDVRVVRATPHYPGDKTGITFRPWRRWI